MLRVVTIMIVSARKNVISRAVAVKGQTSARKRTRGVLWYVVAIGCACLFVLPFGLLLLAVFKTPAQAAATPAQYWPSPFSLSAFRQLFGGSVDIGHYVLNSLVVSVGTVVGTLVITVLGGYGFHRYPFRGSGVLFGILLAILMVPFQSVITPLYVVLDHVHLVNSLVGLVLVYITYQLPFGLFVMRTSFSSVPVAISEAAEVDGASTLQGLRRVQWPLVVPGVLTVSIFAFIGAWNDFLAALILLSSQSRFTLPVILMDIVTGQFGIIDWGVLEAGVLISMVPCVLLFLILQRYYMGGILSGAVK